MTVDELKNAVMFQTNNDTDDVADFTPYLLDYINEGYDNLVFPYAGAHIGTTDYPRLSANADEPNLPTWSHHAIADYATYRIYQNGNATKQSRGVQFLGAFNVAQHRLMNEPITGPVTTFKNVPW